MDNVVEKLRLLQVQRRFAIASQQRPDRAVESLMARVLMGTDPELEKKAAHVQAGKIRCAIEKAAQVQADKIRRGLAIEKDNEYSGELANLSTLVINCAKGRAPWDDHRAAIEKEMCQLAKTLPVWSFVKPIKGLSELGLAVLVGEAGNIGTYASEAALWKRFGVGLIGGRRQGQPETNTAEEWIRHGYNPSRRAELWVFCDDVMVRTQWRPKQGGAQGKYGAAYSRKKAEYLAREWTPKRADSAARRFASKMLLRDIYRHWNGIAKTNQNT